MNAALLVASALLLAASACGGAKPADGRPSVVATIFPLYDFAKSVGGDAVSVSLLLPPGVEAHAFDPKPGDLERIARADVFVYTCESMEPWAPALAESAKSVPNGRKTIVTEAADGIELMRADGPADDEDGRAGVHAHEGGDPHVWLDPVLASHLVDSIEAALTEAMPDKAALFAANAASCREELSKLDADIAAALARCERKTIVSGGHFAFGYFARRYGLEAVSPFEGFSPDAEPGARGVANLVDAVRKTGATAVFFEELSDPRVARVIAEETGAKLLLLHAAHNVSKRELESGVTFVGIMRGNLERLKQGLGYR